MSSSTVTKIQEDHHSGNLIDTSNESSAGFQPDLIETISVQHIEDKKGFLRLKRCFDLIASLIAGTIALIPMAIIAILIRLDSHGPAFFRQERVGKGGKIFYIYKFRTLSVDAPRNVATRELDDIDRLTTKLGRFLRITSLDELPQLWNIIKGDMSLIGYRPLCVSEEYINNLRKEKGVFLTRPGLTGYAQVCGRDLLEPEEKVYYDVEYISQMSVKMDIKCILKTVRAVITHEGAK